MFAHDDGVYSVDLNEEHVASGGEEGAVRVWARADGALLSTLCHHDYIVWNVSFWLDRLFTCSYDCTVAYLTPRAAKGEEGEELFVVRRRIKGPLWWADAFCADRQGRYLSTHDENTFGVDIWDLNKSASNDHTDTKPFVRLLGHENDVHCVKLLLPLVISGSADATVRIWSVDDGGSCLRVLRGHEGKVWAVDADSRRIISGGRYGEVRVWSLEAAISDLECEDEMESRELRLHDRSTAVGQVKLLRAQLVTTDGVGRISIADFWRLKPTAPAAPPSPP